MRDQSAGLAVVIGRFQPFHNGHARLLERALALAPRVLVVIGSAFRARTPRNPFTWRERAAMITGCLSAVDRERVTLVPVRDYYDDGRWTGAVREIVRQHAPDGTKVTLVGHDKDASTCYLRGFAGWLLVGAKSTLAVDGTHVRRMLFETDDAGKLQALLAELVPPAVCRYLLDVRSGPCHATLVREHRALEAYRASWRTAPFPPTFVTVDAIVKAAGHVLLIQRGHFPGQGLWAMPGGFLDQHERLQDAAIRELLEETSLAVAPSVLAGSLTGVRVYDHPGRSQCGRTITHVHLFELGTSALPCVTAADDAAQAVWLRLEDVASLEDAFHDDHFHILDAMLGLTGGPSTRREA